MLNDHQDAFGHGVYDYFSGRVDTAEIIERDDGYIDTSGGPKAYFSEYKDWQASEKKAMRYAEAESWTSAAALADIHSIFRAKA